MREVPSPSADKRKTLLSWATLPQAEREADFLNQIGIGLAPPGPLPIIGTSSSIITNHSLTNLNISECEDNSEATISVFVR